MQESQDANSRPVRPRVTRSESAAITLHQNPSEVLDEEGQFWMDEKHLVGIPISLRPTESTITEVLLPCEAIGVVWQHSIQELRRISNPPQHDWDSNLSRRRVQRNLLRLSFRGQLSRIRSPPSTMDSTPNVVCGCLYRCDGNDCLPSIALRKSFISKDPQ